MLINLICCRFLYCWFLLLWNVLYIILKDGFKGDKVFESRKVYLVLIKENYFNNGQKEGFKIFYVLFDFLGDEYLDIVRVYYGLGCVFGVLGFIDDVLESLNKVCSI